MRVSSAGPTVIHMSHGHAAEVGAPEVTPDAILELGFGFWGSKTLLSAVELGVFSELAEGLALHGEALRERLGLHPRAASDFFDALVTLGMLERENGRYANTPASELYLDPAKPSYVGGILEMAGARLYGFWASLTEGLHTGLPQNEAKRGEDFFKVLYSDPARLAQFARAMSALSVGAAEAIAAKFPWRDHQSVVDVGCAEGAVPARIALAHEHITGGGFDLPAMGPIFEGYVARLGLGGRLRFTAGDFFVDPLPEADAYILMEVIHDWPDAEAAAVLSAVRRAASPGARVLIIENVLAEGVTDPRGRTLDVIMLAVTGGCERTAAQFERLLDGAGFRDTTVIETPGPLRIVEATAA